MTLLQAGRDLLARGGVPELYQGLGVTLIGSMPAVGVYFGLYQFVKKQMDAVQDMSPYVSITVSAGVGNFIARCCAIYCVWRVACFVFYHRPRDSFGRRTGLLFGHPLPIEMSRSK